LGKKKLKGVMPLSRSWYKWDTSRGGAEEVGRKRSGKQSREGVLELGFSGEGRVGGKV
jgi:hypothetical protein